MVPVRLAQCWWELCHLWYTDRVGEQLASNRNAYRLDCHRRRAPMTLVPGSNWLQPEAIPEFYGRHQLPTPFSRPWTPTDLDAYELTNK